MTIETEVAAVASIADAILPPNASDLERAILTAELARLALSPPEIIKTIWNPATCPVALLPWLAQGVSVDVWSDGWTEARKRAVIAASPLVHRHKGTIGAVNRALAAFDLDAEIVEWWQDDARRGTFRVDINYSNGSPIYDAEVQAFAVDAVKAAKPKSRVLTTRAVLTARASVHVGVFAQAQIAAIAHPYQFDPPVLRAGAYVGVVPAAFMAATAKYVSSDGPVAPDGYEFAADSSGDILTDSSGTFLIIPES